ncbi:MAG TPA: YbjN domain-containing protein [Verrucomicrobiales bacterium]|nr:YbjN domain-containing protein [Verrucomicrobiales bacterium]
MPELISKLEEVFHRRGWSFERVPGRLVIRADFEAHHTRVPVHVQAFPEICGIHVVSGSPIRFPATHRAAAAELILRSCQEMTLGALEMDWDQGSVVFRASNLFAGLDQVDDGIVAGLVHAGVTEMDRLTPYLSVLRRESPEGVSQVDIPGLLARRDLDLRAALEKDALAGAGVGN